MQTPTIATSAEALERERRLLGFEDGAPAQMPPEILRIDLRVYRHSRCDACSHRGQIVRPMHRGHDYKLLLECPSCGAGSEG